LLGVGCTAGVGLLLIYAGLKRLDPSFQAFLARSHPVMVILLGVVFLKDRLRPVELLPMSVMLLGGFVSVYGRWGAVSAGVILTLVGFASFAFHRLFVKMLSGKLHVEVIVFYRAAIAAVVVSLWVLPAIRRGNIDFNVPVRFYAVTFLGALIAPVAGNLLSFHAYRYWSLSRGALVLMMQPLFVLPMALVFLGRLPTAQGLIGGCVILAGAFWMTWMHMRFASAADRTAAAPPAV
jgi:drug/metabolite transporter (DMT)-like permease